MRFFGRLRVAIVPSLETIQSRKAHCGLTLECFYEARRMIGINLVVPLQRTDPSFLVLQVVGGVYAHLELGPRAGISFASR